MTTIKTGTSVKCKHESDDKLVLFIPLKIKTLMDNMVKKFKLEDSIVIETTTETRLTKSTYQKLRDSTEQSDIGIKNVNYKVKKINNNVFIRIALKIIEKVL